MVDFGFNGLGAYPDGERDQRLEERSNQALSPATWLAAGRDREERVGIVIRQARGEHWISQVMLWGAIAESVGKSSSSSSSMTRRW